MKRYQLRYTVFICTALSFIASHDISARHKKKPKHVSNALQKSIEKSDAPQTVTIDYNNTDLSTIINQLAALKQINILLPSGGIKEKITFSLDKKVSVDQAWNLLQTILDAAEYTMIPKNNILTITKSAKEKEIGREPLEIYVNTPYKELPDSDMVIRYIHYLTNIKVTDDTSNEVSTLLNELLPKATSSFITDAVANALIIAARARDIKAVMEIISRLDQPGFEEKMEIIPLQFSECSILASLFNDNILKTTQSFQPYNIKAPQKSDVSYFEKDTRIMADERTNSLIVVGRSQAVDRIREFIKAYLDVPADSGRSVLHVYELRYLEAESFEKVLTRIVDSSKGGGTGQSRAGDAKGGTERYFDGVIIKADSFTSKNEAAGASVINGSNKLIIAARDDDWERIKKLIQELDVPQRQVFIEILIADLTIDDQRALGAIFRNPANIPLPAQMDFQAGHLRPGILTNTYETPPPQTAGYIENDGNPVASDLMRNTLDSSGNRVDGGSESIAALLPGGTTALALCDDDGKAWSLLNVLKLFGHSKILTHPHIIAVHNKKATVTVGNNRLLPDAVTGNINPTIANKEIEASLKVNMTPRISTGEMVNIEIDIDINEFLPGPGNDRSTRKVITNANVQNGGVLAIGGLVRTNEQASANETPILSRIPIIGWFFKNKKNETLQNNLTVFICPTIIEPSVRSGIAQYTKDYIALTKEYAKDNNLFGDLRDPITHWFFSSGAQTEEASIMQFFAKNQTYDEKGDRTKPFMTPAKDRVPTPPESRINNRGQVNTPVVETAYNNQADAQKLKELLENDSNPFVHEDPVHIAT